jgi:MerR family mercuric resistance operon transcriptional regulator
MVDRLMIGQLAKMARVNVETVRYYERRGLLPEPDRRPSGYRSYTPDAARRIQFIRHAQQLGFSLNEVSDLLRLRVDPEMSCREVRQRANAKIDAIEHKIEQLQGMRQALVTLAETCSGEGPISECPFLDALDLQAHERVDAE